MGPQTTICKQYGVHPYEVGIKEQEMHTPYIPTYARYLPRYLRPESFLSLVEFGSGIRFDPPTPAEKGCGDFEPVACVLASMQHVQSFGVEWRGRGEGEAERAGGREGGRGRGSVDFGSG